MQPFEIQKIFKLIINPAFRDFMDAQKIFSRKGIIFLLLFSVLSLIGMNINFSKLVGAENQFFTLFQFFGPIAGSFLGPIAGALSVLIA